MSIPMKKQVCGISEFTWNAAQLHHKDFTLQIRLLKSWDWLKAHDSLTISDSKKLHLILEVLEKPVSITARARIILTGMNCSC